MRKKTGPDPVVIAEIDRLLNEALERAGMERTDLAEAIDCSPSPLYQCAGTRSYRPLSERLISEIVEPLKLKPAAGADLLAALLLGRLESELRTVSACLNHLKSRKLATETANKLTHGVRNYLRRGVRG